MYTDINDPNDEIRPNKNINIYLKYFIDQTNIMYNEITLKIDKLFEFYKNELFSSTDKLFYLNSDFLSIIFCYSVPTTKYQENSDERIQHVFNANIWFFYFFKYLNLLDELDFTNIY